MAEWKQVSPAEAKQHKYYGVGGWLVVFIVGTLIGLLVELGALAGAANEAGLSIRSLIGLDSPAAEFVRLNIALHIFAVVILYWMLIFKRPSFRLFTIWIYIILPYPFAVFTVWQNPFPEIGGELGVWLPSWLIYAAIWVTYLQRSKRVRVTFEHYIRSDEGRGDIQASAEDAPPRRIIQNTFTTQQSEIDAFKETSAQVKQEGVLAQASVGEVVNILHNAFLTQYGSVEGFKASESRKKIDYLTKLYEMKQKYQEMGALSGFAASLFNMWVSALVDNNKILEKETGKELDYFGKIAAGIDDNQPVESVSHEQTNHDDADEQNVDLFKTQDIDINDDNDEVDWAQALAEFEGDSRRPGLWAKAFAYAKGDEILAKTIYLKQRVPKLRQEREEQEAKLRQERLADEAKFHQERLENDLKLLLEGENIDDETIVGDIKQSLGVSFDGEKFNFLEYRYDHFEDAIDYAMNKYSEDGYTPLMRAAGSGEISLVKALISLGANPKLTGRISGAPTALSMAIVSLTRAKDQKTRDAYQSIIDILKPIS